MKDKQTHKLTSEQVDLLLHAVKFANPNWFDSVRWHELHKIHDILEDATEITVKTA